MSGYRPWDHLADKHQEGRVREAVLDKGGAREGRPRPLEWAEPAPWRRGRLQREQLDDSCKQLGLVVRQHALQENVRVAGVDSVCLHEPFQTLLGWFEQEIGRESPEKRRQRSVQFLQNLGRLYGPLELLATLGEQRVLELGEGGVDTDQLLEPVATQREEGVSIYVGSLPPVEQERGALFRNKLPQGRLSWDG